MRRDLLLLTFLLLLPGSADPAGAMQDVVVGARVGTMGIGADVTVPVHDRVAVRGGAGMLGFDFDLTGRFGLNDDRTAMLTLPKAFYTLGADIRLGSVRVGAGVLFKSGKPIYRVTLDSGANIVIGGGTYDETEVKTLTTTLSRGLSHRTFSSDSDRAPRPDSPSRRTSASPCPPAQGSRWAPPAIGLFWSPRHSSATSR